jgi:hypothetical protein
MLSLCLVLLAAMLLPSPGSAAPPQNDSNEYAVEGPHPRLLLPPRRLRLLQRERERESPRWLQFKSVLSAGGALPEPGFAHALYSVVSGDAAHLRSAIGWALQTGGDLRQLALVYDWCFQQLSPEEASKLAASLRDGIENARSHDDLPSVRSRLLAAVALADEDPALAVREMRFVVQEWWEGKIIPGLKRGEAVIGRNDSYALLEILHVVRDHLKLDLRQSYKAYFAALPIYHLLTYYPATYPAAGNDFHIPVFDGAGEPDLRLATLSRAAELSLVAFDPNALETQFLQGWCMQDRFIMLGAFGIPYEFLWANPYHPGLSYYNAPLVLHQPDRGLLVARSSWEETTAWFYHGDGMLQTFREGEIKRLSLTDLAEPLELGRVIVRAVGSGGRFDVSYEEAVTCYFLGLEPGQRYDIEVDDEEIYEDTADRGGILVLEVPAGRKAGVRIRAAGSLGS